MMSQPNSESSLIPCTEIVPAGSSGEIGMSATVAELESSLQILLEQLFQRGVLRGHWGDVRATADVLIAFDTCFASDAFPCLGAVQILFRSFPSDSR